MNSYAADTEMRGPHGPATSSVRQADERAPSNDLASYLNKNRVDPPTSSGSGRKTGGHRPIVANDPTSNGESAMSNGGAAHTGTEVKCGPLINYRGMEGGKWIGSILIVINGGGLSSSGFLPELKLRKVGSVGQHATNGVDNVSSIKGLKLYSDPRSTYWRFTVSVPMEETEVEWEYTIPGLSFTSTTKADRQRFFVPAVTQSMRIMFHSCNGFSVGTDEEAYSGAALWNDVQRVHSKTPFHVMIGGGDQIYNDGIRVHGPLKEWTSIHNPKKRRDYLFPEELRKKCAIYYEDNYAKWYSTEPFAGANGQIPQLNIWDDHDIIDGFGSYINYFMQCPVFRGIGGVAYKYYMLFQHHLPPPVSTFTTDTLNSNNEHDNSVASEQTKDTFVLQDLKEESAYIIGNTPGPYVAEKSRSMYARLGARIAFFGIDARTERTRHQVNYEQTYQIIMTRLRKELGEAMLSSSPIQHMIVLLGIPIAYPRLTWLENILRSPLIGPVKFLNKHFGVAEGVFNHFDGGVDLLDDLDDHYTAGVHKKERADLVHMLQDLAAEFSVRITILGGDVHLAAVGRFYSNMRLNIPIKTDHRYMANIISSAIVNKPPPPAIANLLARRNKIHHLDHDTDETLLSFFDKDPSQASKTAAWNHVTMPSRNWAMLTENTSSSAAPISAEVTNGDSHDTAIEAGDKLPKAKDGHSPLHRGEVGAGSEHRAATEDGHGHGGEAGSLDIAIRVEIDQHDKEGKTKAYGMLVPRLEYEKGSKDKHTSHRDRARERMGR